MKELKNTERYDNWNVVTKNKDKDTSSVESVYDMDNSWFHKFRQ